MKLKKLPYVLLALMLLAPMLPAHVAGAQGITHWKTVCAAGSPPKKTS
ncbi:MAG: hypothetical protein M5R40_06410 [Anaerolineae bacterium]|nr:hypothetical protein [Anaerolineae bacterium]